ncbi:DUF5020 family protein [Marinobacter salinisoli]|nr:DUF5020 family protein [Marinobacter salinisoli]
MNTFGKAVAAAFVASAMAPAAHAEKFFSSSSVSALYGTNYKVTPEELVTFTFENVTAHNWGDTFFFIDRLQSRGDGERLKETYGEFSPRVSMGWLTGQPMTFGPVKDVLFAYTYEFGVNDNPFVSAFDNHLAGIGLSWDVPGFQYVDTNVYYANNDETADDWQLTVTWGLPFSVGQAAFLFDGFMDYSSAASDHKAEMHINPQLKLDLGAFSNNPGVLYAGVEYSYWRNKFGLDRNLPLVDGTENVVSALVKFHF